LRKFLKYNLWAILWGLVILILLCMPGKVFPRLPAFLDLFRPDKLVHFFIFGVYGALQTRGLWKQVSFERLRRHAVLYSVIWGSSLGTLTEILQRYWIPMRTGSVYDLIADVAGCLLGALIYKRTVKNAGR